MTLAPPHLAAMMTAAEIEWRANASEDWTAVNFWRWPRGFHRSAWVVAGYVSWNPLDVLDQLPPAAQTAKAERGEPCCRPNPWTLGSLGAIGMAGLAGFLLAGLGHG